MGESITWCFFCPINFSLLCVFFPSLFAAIREIKSSAMWSGLIMLHKGEVINIYRSQSSEMSNCCRKIIIYRIGWNGNVVSVEDCQRGNKNKSCLLFLWSQRVFRLLWTSLWAEYLMVMRVSSVILKLKICYFKVQIWAQKTNQWTSPGEFYTKI